MQAFRQDESGVVLVLVALLLAVLIVIAGFAIDYASAQDVKAELQRAVDAAALTVARSASEDEAKAKLQAYIAANLSPGVAALNPVVTLVSWESGKAEISVAATAPTPFRGLFGAATPIAAFSTAVQSATYFDIYAAVDMSGSLSIAADDKNRAKLEALTGCEFACHQLEGAAVSNYDVARQNGVQLREDVLNAAFSSFIGDVLTTNPDNKTHRRVDVLGFAGPSGAPADKMVRDLTGGPTSDLTAAQSALSKFPNDFKVNTYFEIVLPQVLADVGPQGTGYTQSSPRKMLVLITDGVRSDRCCATYPIDNPIDNYQGSALPSPRDCQAIKNAGITLAVIDVKYFNSTKNYWFNYWLGSRRPDAVFTAPPATGTVYDEISPALRACASHDPSNTALPGGQWYFEATDTDRIKSALESLLDAINKSSVRLAN